MSICPACQFTNPPDHKFCQRCGEPLTSATEVSAAEVSAAEVSAAKESPAEPQPDSQPDNQPLKARLIPYDAVGLAPATYLDDAQRYQIITVLAQGYALIKDMTPEVRSPLQDNLPKLTQAPIEDLRSQQDLPAAAYPYLLLSEAAPSLRDAWEKGDTTVLILASEEVSVSALLKAFSTAVDPLQHVYWLYTLTDLWIALSDVPQWRSSLLLADNLSIDADQSLRVRQFITPADTPPTLSELKAFLQSLLAQPHGGTIAPLRQIREIVLTVTSAETLDQLRSELAAIGEALLTTPEAITPAVTYSGPALHEEGASLPTEKPIAALSEQMQMFAEQAKTPEPTPEPASESTSESTPEPAPEPTSESAPEQTPSVSTAMTEPSSASPIDDTEASDTAILETAEIDLPEPATGSDETTMVLPMRLTALEDVGQTDVGRQRDHNEDCFLIASSLKKYAENSGRSVQAHCLYVLCDGMGGHEGGEVASQLAAQTLSDYFEKHWPHKPLPGEPSGSLPSDERLIEAVKLANRAIYDVNEQDGRVGHRRMGTTLVMVLLQGTEAVVAHVGDSRLYQYTRRTGLRQVTVDHEVGQREIQRGIPHDIAYGRPDAYQLTQALGPRESEEVKPSVSRLTFSEDTLLLLCSDGLSDNNLIEDHTDSHIDPLLRRRKDLETGVDELIRLGNEVNGHDNISAIAIRLDASPDLNRLRGKSSNSSQTLLQ
ncbi:MAG: serine/threonine phosphatase [Phormidesmis sp.]